MNEEIQKLLKEPYKLGHYLGFTKLRPFHSEWIRKYWLSKDDYILQAHRNSYKTTGVIVTGYIWYSLQYPDDTVLLVREEGKNAENTITTIAGLLKSEEVRYLYQELYGIKDFQLVKDNRNSIILPTKTKITIEGSLDCIGMGGSLTGRHYKKIIADDIITIKDRVSKAKREETKYVLMELENIKTADGTLSVSGTPWHKDDGFTILPTADKFPIGSIDIPDLTKIKIDDIRQRTTASLFASNYLLKHIAEEGRIFSEAKFIQWDRNQTCRGWVDPAYSGKCTTSLTLIYFDDKKIIVKGWAWRQDITELYEKIKIICGMYNCGTLFIESNADQGLSAKDMAKIYPSVRPIREKENKHNKIISYAKQNWIDIYFDNDCQEDYLSQVIDYEEGQEPMDAPDGLASLIRQIKPDNVSVKKSISVKEYDKEYEW